jgi:hypothetical protein
MICITGRHKENDGLSRENLPNGIRQFRTGIKDSFQVFLVAELTSVQISEVWGLQLPEKDSVRRRSYKSPSMTPITA